MRLFVAVDLDNAARGAVAEEQRRIAQAIGGSHRTAPRWVPPERLHMTLMFLGEVADGLMPHLTEAFCAELIAEPFTVALKGLGIFPPWGAPRALWIGLGEGANEIVDAQREMADRMMRVGIHLEERPYHPHLTLARWRTSRPADGRCVLAADRHREVARVDVDHITLYRSQLSTAGPSYTALARVTLTACRSSSSLPT